MGNNERTHVSIQIPTDLVEIIDDMLAKNRIAGFRSRNEFCVDAVRKSVEHYKQKRREG